MTEKRKRGANYNADEKNLLLNLIFTRKNIIENKKTDMVNNKEKQNAWEQITKSFNAGLPNSEPRTVESLKKFYDNVKKKVRIDATRERKSLLQTGGGISEFTPDPNLDLALSIVNKKTVEGLNNDFDGDSSDILKAKNIEQDHVCYYIY